MAFDKRDREADVRPKVQARRYHSVSGLYDGKKIVRVGKRYLKDMFYYSFEFFKDKLERMKKLKRLIKRRKAKKEHLRWTNRK